MARDACVLAQAYEVILVHAVARVQILADVVVPALMDEATVDALEDSTRVGERAQAAGA